MADNSGGARLSLYENELYGQVEVVEPSWEMVFFLLTDEWYAVDILNVKEILPPQPLTTLPNVPDHVMGIISLRGIIVPIIHLKTLFGLPSVEDSDAGLIMVITKGDMVIGVLVDAADQVVSVPISKIEKKLPTLQSEKTEWITGQMEHDGRVVALLDVGKLIDKTRL